MFLSFTNFYKKFIKNFSKIEALLISILQIIGDNDQSTLANASKKNQATAGRIDNDRVDKGIENLSTIIKSKKSDYAKVNFFGRDFLTFKTK